MSKVYGWFKEPVRVILITGLIYFVAVGIRAAYFTDAWYKFW